MRRRYAASDTPSDDKDDTHADDFGFGWGTKRPDGITPAFQMNNPSRLGPLGEDVDVPGDHSNLPTAKDVVEASSELPGHGRKLAPQKFTENTERWTDPAEGVDYDDQSLLDDHKSFRANATNNPFVCRGSQNPTRNAGNQILEETMSANESIRTFLASSVAGNHMLVRADKLKIDPNTAEQLGDSYTQIEQEIDELKALLVERAGDLLDLIDSKGKKLGGIKKEIISHLEASGADIKALREHSYTVGRAVFGFKRTMAANPPMKEVLEDTTKALGHANAEIVAQIVEMRKSMHPQVRNFEVMMSQRPKVASSPRHLLALRQKHAGTKQAGVVETLESALDWWKTLYRKFAAWLNKTLVQSKKTEDVISKRSREIIDTLRSARDKLAKLEAEAAKS